VITHQVTDKTGPVAIARMVNAMQELIVISADGIVLRTRLDSIAQVGRGSQGVQVIRLAPGDRVASLATIDMAAPTASQAPVAAAAEAAKKGAPPGRRPPERPPRGRAEKPAPPGKPPRAPSAPPAKARGPSRRPTAGGHAPRAAKPPPPRRTASPGTKPPPPRSRRPRG
jgi:hypothetical protein